MKRDEGKEKFWRQAIAEVRGGGQSVREVCQARGLNESQFYWWRRELRLRDAEVTNKHGFVELVGSAEKPGGTGVSLRVDDRCSIVLERGFDGETLKTVLACLHVDSGAHTQGREVHGQ